MTVVVLPRSIQNQSARDLKQRILICLHKLSDRDTHASAALELETIAKSLSANTIPSFISSITATDSSDKLVVRKQCINLISVLALHHGDSLSPYLSKLLSAVLRGLRDRDTAIRSACISAVSSIASHVTKASFTILCKPFLEALYTEQEVNSQVGTATCLSALIEASAEPDLLLLRKAMVRFEKLVKCESFKAKSAVVVLIGRCIGIGVVAGSSKKLLERLVACLVELLSSEDWTVRKASAEALIKIAVAENEALLDFKAPCLKTFEAKKFDKIKAVRETMNQMVEAWKDIPHSFLEEASVSPYPQSYYSNDSANAVTYPLASNITCSGSPPSASVRKKHNKTSYRMRRHLHDTDKRIDAATMFRKPERMKPSSGLKAEICTSSCDTAVSELDEDKMKEDDAFKKGENKQRLVKRAMAHDFHNDKKSESSVNVAALSSEDITWSDKEGDINMSLIHEQLVQIENQQSHLLDLMRKFMGSSERGIHCLETRVNGLEQAVDEISFEISGMSTSNIGQYSSSSSRMVCCNLPSPKIWRRTGGHFIQTRSNNRYSISNSSSSSHHHPHHPPPEVEAVGELVNRRCRLQGDHSIIVNPLASQR